LGKNANTIGYFCRLFLPGTLNALNVKGNFSLDRKKPLYDYILKVCFGQILNARGEQFREPQDGP
jgi:hypothetical protein